MLFYYLVVFLFASAVNGYLFIQVTDQKIQKSLFGTYDKIKLVDNGKLSTLFSGDTLNILPSIQPEYNQLAFRLTSNPVRLYYTMELSTDNSNVMSQPTVDIQMYGRLDKNRWREFTLRFPCSGNKSGTVTLGFFINFYMDEKRTLVYKRINLSMQRECKKAITFVEPTPKSCRKKCDQRGFQHYFCSSDFVTKYRIIEANLKSTNPHYIGHVGRTMYRQTGTTEYTRKNQRIESLGESVTCDCRTMKPGKKYLVFGRVDRTNQNLMISNYSLAFEIKGSKGPDPLMRWFRKHYVNFKCHPLQRWRKIVGSSNFRR